MEDIINIIGKNYVERKKLHEAFNFEFKEDFSKIVLDRLRNHVYNPEEFIKELKENNAYLSGSFILSCLLNTGYNDIDLYEYADMEYDNKFLEFNKLPRLQQFFYKSHYKSMNSCIYDDIIYIIRDYEAKKDSSVLIQHIVCRVNIKEFIFNVFDMNFCKCIYNGELTVYDWNSLYTRFSMINPISSLIKSYNYHNYLRRAAAHMSQFSFSKIDQLLKTPEKIDIYQHKENLLDIYRERIKKYEQRGFKITYPPKYGEMINYIIKFMNLHIMNTEIGIDGLIMYKLFDFQKYKEEFKFLSF